MTTNINYVYLYLLSPLHTGGTTQEGNLLGIAREVHTQLPYIPSSTIRGRLRASVEDEDLKVQLFGSELKRDSNDEKKEENAQNQENNDSSQYNQLTQGDIWIGDASLLWFPVASLSHGVVWITCPRLLKRWLRLNKNKPKIPVCYSTNLVNNQQNKNQHIYLKDAIIKSNLSYWKDWKEFVPKTAQNNGIDSVLLLPDNHCATLISMSLWRQVKIKLDQDKAVDGGFRYEEAIPPDTLVYFPWGITVKAKNYQAETLTKLQDLVEKHEIETDSEKSIDIIQDLFVTKVISKNKTILQIGGQESLGRGFVEQFLDQKNGQNKEKKGGK